MNRTDRTPEVGAWMLPEVRLERYRHAPGPGVPIPKHAHDGYQFGLSLDAAGEYHWRGTRHPIPPGALRLIQPGEVHASQDFGGPAPVTTHLLYVPVPVLREAAAGAAGRPAGEPAFPFPVAPDPELARAFLRLCLALSERPAPRLEQDSLLQATLARFVERHADARLAPTPPGLEHRAVWRVKAYLDEHLAENVPLSDLARLVDLNPHYLDRAFARLVGLPPHRYQVQARVERAKTLLAAGVPPGEVARRTGFADQSHLGRHFKRLVGVPPGRYRPPPSGRGRASGPVDG